MKLTKRLISNIIVAVALIYIIIYFYISYDNTNGVFELMAISIAAFLGEFIRYVRSDEFHKKNLMRVISIALIVTISTTTLIYMKLTCRDVKNKVYIELTKDVSYGSFVDMKLIQSVTAGKNKYAFYTDDNSIGLVKYKRLLLNRYGEKIIFAGGDYKSEGYESGQYIRKYEENPSDASITKYIILFGYNEKDEIGRIQVDYKFTNSQNTEQQAEFKITGKSFFAVSFKAEGISQSIKVFDRQDNDITDKYFTNNQ